jgi:hypothetical protein
MGSGATAMVPYFLHVSFISHLLFLVLYSDSCTILQGGSFCDGHIGIPVHKKNS